jgi:hypothetical protein
MAMDCTYNILYDLALGRFDLGPIWPGTIWLGGRFDLLPLDVSIDWIISHTKWLRPWHVEPREIDEKSDFRMLNKRQKLFKYLNNCNM